jgi:hypothetical protein
LKALLISGGPLSPMLAMVFGDTEADHYLKIATIVLGTIASVYGTYWTIVSGKDSAILTAATEVKGVDFQDGKIVVTPAASSSAQKAAASNDPTYSGITPK